MTGTIAAVYRRGQRSRMPTQTIVIDASAFHHSRLTLPAHPIAGVVSIVDGKGETVPAHHYLVDTDLGLIRYAGNRDFAEYPYTVTFLT